MTVIQRGPAHVAGPPRLLRHFTRHLLFSLLPSEIAERVRIESTRMNSGMKQWLSRATHIKGNAIKVTTTKKL